MTKFTLNLFAALMVVSLSACLPGVQTLVQAPEFTLIPEGSGLQRLDPPGVGAGAAVFRLNLDVRNPNSFGLALAGLDFDLLLNDRRAAQSTFPGGLNLAANGRSRLAVDVSVPLSEGIALLSDLVGLIAGQPTRYALRGTVSLDVLGSRQTLPSATIVAGSIQQPLALVAPSVRFVSERSGLREFALNRAVIEVGLELNNPSPLGYRLTTPGLELSLAGVQVGHSRVVSHPVAAGATTPLALRFEFSPVSLGLALANRLEALSRGGSNLEVLVSGDFGLKLPGITSRSFSLERLAAGVLR